jgi:hypothetical protein
MLTKTVDTLVDEIDGSIIDGDISIRDAISFAIQGETINFAPSLNGQTISLTLGQITIPNKSLTIDASELLAGIKINAQGNSRIFNITAPNPNAPPTDTFKNLTLMNGNANTGDFFGGAIRSEGRLIIEKCTIENSGATRGGGIFVQALGLTGTPIDQSEPVDIFTLQNSVIRGNLASGDGGGLFVASYTYSGEISDARVTITGSRIEGNRALQGGTGHGGGLFVSFGGFSGPSAIPGSDSELVIDRSTISDNQADILGGGVWFQAGTGTQVTLRDSTISGNGKAGPLVTQTNQGGGVYALFRATESAVNDKPRFTISGSTFEANEALTAGGGVFMCAKNNGEFVVVNSTFSGNMVTAAGGIGGGILVAVPEPNLYYQPNDIDAYIHNSTITGNFAPIGGGVYGQNDFTTTFNEHHVNLRVRNSIISENKVSTTNSTPSNLAGRVVAADTLFNLLGDDSTGLADAITGNAVTLDPANMNLTNNNAPGLDPLADNGGPTKTRRPLTGSPVIDRGSNDFDIDPLGGAYPTAGSPMSAPLDHDQRGPGFGRVFDVPGIDPLGIGGAIVDIGAYEIGLPKVADVIIGSTITDAIPDEEETAYTNPDYRFIGVVGSGGQLRTALIGAPDRVSVQFSERVSMTAAEIAEIVVDRYIALPSVTFTAPNSSNNFTATLTYAAPLPYGHHLLVVKDAVLSDTGFNLDGEWTNPKYVTTTAATSRFPSGNGAEGGAFSFVYTILPGDMTLNNIVNGLDITPFSTSITNPSLNPNAVRMADITANGYVNGLDISPFTALLTTQPTINLTELKLVANYDTDWDIDQDDQAAFDGYYLAGDLRADLNKDGQITSDDDIAFEAYFAFFAGLNLSVVT